MSLVSFRPRRCVAGAGGFKENSMPAMEGKLCECGAKIFFAKTTTGANAPFDAADTTVYAADAEGVMRNAGKGHVIHFVTCPKRDKFKKPAPTPAPKAGCPFPLEERAG
jgi:hypothetical protein